MVRGQGFWPSVDGAVIPYQPLAAFEAGIHHRVPIIVGTSPFHLLAVSPYSLKVVDVCAQAVT